MNNLRECIHKEILLARFVVRDEISKQEFAMCGKCWRRVKHLSGFILVEQSFRKLETKIAQQRALKDVSF